MNQEITSCGRTKAFGHLPLLVDVQMQVEIKEGQNHVSAQI